jgi:cytochrome d ubiquinol oxidase subunit II
MTTLYRPLSLVALGVILRGAGFALRHHVHHRLRPVLTATFGVSSVLTPWFLGAFAGAVASGQVPSTAANTAWLHPVSLVGGTLAVCTCAYLAAVYLCAEAARGPDPGLTAAFRARALAAGAVCAAMAALGAVVLHADAARLFQGLVHRALPLSVLSGTAAAASLALVWRGRFRGARAAAALAVGAVIWAWGVAQFPYVLPPSLTVTAAAAAHATLVASVIAAGVGSALVLPALGLLFVLRERGVLQVPGTDVDGVAVVGS